MRGLLKDTTSVKIIFPPNNRTNWYQTDDTTRNQMRKYICSTSYMDPSLKPMNSFSFFPANDTDLSPEKINQTQQIINDLNFTQYINNPTPVDANVVDQLKEHMSRRRQVLFYDNEMQKHKFVHFKHDQRNGDRFLIPFYVFHFFEDWKQDLWTKRFVRDHLRYNDELMCAAARVVGALREKAREYEPLENSEGRFNTSEFIHSDILMYTI